MCPVAIGPRPFFRMKSEMNFDSNSIWSARFYPERCLGISRTDLNSNRNSFLNWLRKKFYHNSNTEHCGTSFKISTPIFLKLLNANIALESWSNSKGHLILIQLWLSHRSNTVLNFRIFISQWRFDFNPTFEFFRNFEISISSKLLRYKHHLDFPETLSTEVLVPVPNSLDLSIEFLRNFQFVRF